ncbi:hypothetical protein Landi51_04634 [Colletotrichum acutatum]
MSLRPGPKHLLHDPTCRQAAEYLSGERNLALAFLPTLLGPEEHPHLRSQPAINPPSQLQNFISPSDRLPININKQDPARQRLHYCVHYGNACTRHRI